MASGNFPNLEPNHALQLEPELIIILCPFINPDTGHNFETSWSKNARPAEINCLWCEYLNGELHHAGPPVHSDEDPGTPPPIQGAQHPIAHVSDYQPCRVPLRRIQWCDVSLVTHEGCVPSLMRIDRKWRAADGPNRYPLRQGDTASYVCRHIAGSSQMSKHSWACAVDNNWETNGYNAAHHDIPQWFVDIWISEGWGWGGNWHSSKDWMHTSRFPNEGGNGLLYDGDETGDEEDDMAQVPQDEWEQLKKDVATILERTSIQIVKDGAKKDMGIDHVSKTHAQQQGWLKPDGTWAGS